MLDEARTIIQDVRLSDDQEVNAASVNLSNAAEVRVPRGNRIYTYQLILMARPLLLG